MKETLPKTQCWAWCTVAPSNVCRRPKTLEMKPKGYQCFIAWYMTSQTKWFWERMSEEWTVVPIPYPTTVNVQITVPEMANGGKPRQTCDHLHRELSTCVNYQKKKGCYLACQTVATTITSCLICDRCAKRCMTAMAGSCQPASTPQRG